MKLINIILSYFNEEKKDVMRHIDSWNNFPEDLLQQISFTIIDDCSKVNIKDLLKDCNLNNLDLSLFRIKEDIKWNTSGVRNLGALHSESKYLLILDMDTIVNSDICRKLIDISKNNINKSIYFDFNRIVVGDDKHPKNNVNHPAVCLIRRQDYWLVNGCDEELSGNYGYTSNLFKCKLEEYNVEKQTLKNISILYYSEAQKDNLDRNRNHNRKIFERKRKDKLLPKKIIRFQWEKVNY